MAYIIGEPIISVTGTNSGATRLTVKFPVMETHSGQRHYRGVSILLEPEKLYMLAENQEAPAVYPNMPLKDFDVPGGRYVDTLINMAELEDEVRKMAEDEGVDLGAAEKLEEWKRNAFKRASSLLFGDN